MRMDLIMGASQLDGFTEYNAHNGSLDKTNNVSINFYTTGWGGGNYGLSTKFPNYYAKKWMYARMGNYAVDSVISSGEAGLWLIKWRKQNDRDSVMYSVWKGSDDGSKLYHRDLRIQLSQKATKEIYNFSTQTADVTSVSQRELDSFTVTEMPVFIFTKKSSETLLGITN